MTEKSDVQERKEFVSSWILASHQLHRTITEDFSWWVGIREDFGGGLDSEQREDFGGGLDSGRLLVVGLY